MRLLSHCRAESGHRIKGLITMDLELTLRIGCSSVWITPGVPRKGAEILLSTMQRSDPLNLIQMMLA